MWEKFPKSAKIDKNQKKLRIYIHSKIIIRIRRQAGILLPKCGALHLFNKITCSTGAAKY